MKVTLYDMAGKDVGKLELSDKVFGLKPNREVMHAAVVNFLANQRQGTQSTLTRAEVRGGGRKPWRQKGTGRARQGSIRSPQWVGGGVAFGPKPRDYSYSLNKKTKRLALLSALSQKAQDGELVAVKDFKVEEYKTKPVIKALDALGVERKALIVTAQPDEKVKKSAGNIPGVKTAFVGALNVYDILHCDKLIIEADAAGKLEEVYA